MSTTLQWNKSSRLRKFLGANGPGPGNESYNKKIFPGVKVPWNASSKERKFRVVLELCSLEQPGSRMKRFSAILLFIVACFCPKTV